MSASPIAIDSLINARWIIPIRPANCVLEQHAIALDKGRILAILPQQEASTLYDAKNQFELNDHVIMPGLINAHGHSPMTLFRGMADDKNLAEWLNDDIWPAESRWVDSGFAYDGSALAIAEMLRGGTTCFADMYFFPEVTARLARDSGIRAQIAFPVLDFPTAWGSGPDEYISKGLALHDEFKNTERVDIAFGPHAPYTVNDKALEKIAMYAHELDTSVQIHLHETAAEVQNSVRETGLRPLARLDSLGLLSPRLQCVHMTETNADDMALLEAHRAHVIHCPQSNLKLASGEPKVQAMLKKGINVALGSDGAASNNSLDMWAEMKSTALLAKSVSQDASALPAFTALEMATINGARALGIDDKTGSLEPGKAADMISINLNHLNTQPVYNAISQLVYSANSTQVEHVWVAGQTLLADGKLTQMDQQKIIENACQWRNRIMEKQNP
ncbi:MAG: TRZ/ATZ family hydrolase [Pseudomonadales bacterium]